MNKKKIIALCVVVALLAICFGSTLAYFMDTDEATNVMTMGSVAIAQYEKERGADGALQDFTQDKPVVPAINDAAWAAETITVGGAEHQVYADSVKNVIDKFVYVENTGKSDAYIRTIIVIEAPGYDANGLIHVNANENANGVTATAWAPLEIDGVQYVYSVFTYTDPVAGGELTPVSLAQVYLDPETTMADAAPYGATWEIYALSQAVQADGFDNAVEALNRAFGEATAANVADWMAD